MINAPNKIIVGVTRDFANHGVAEAVFALADGAIPENIVNSEAVVHSKLQHLTKTSSQDYQ